jgi:hypothetical protein
MRSHFNLGRNPGLCIINPYGTPFPGQEHTVRRPAIAREESQYRKILSEGVEKFLARSGRCQRNQSNPDGDARSWWFVVALFTAHPRGWEVGTQYQIEAETWDRFCTMTEWIPVIVSERKAAWLLDRIVNSSKLPGYE